MVSFYDIEEKKYMFKKGRRFLLEKSLFDAVRFFGNALGKKIAGNGKKFTLLAPVPVPLPHPRSSYLFMSLGFKMEKTHFQSFKREAHAGCPFCIYCILLVHICRVVLDIFLFVFENNSL